jgi:hypothetical protein
MTCKNCDRDEGHADYCYDHPSKVAARQAARDAASVWLDNWRDSMVSACGEKAARTILVWRHYEAPEVFETWDLASQDDMDWIAAIPPDSGTVWWAEEGGSFGCCDVDVVDLPNGWQLRYGYHS